MISQHRIDELLFSEPNMVKIIRQVEIEATAELRERYEQANLRIVELMGDVSDLWAERESLLQSIADITTQKCNAEAERDALRALLAEARGWVECPGIANYEPLLARIDAALREGK